jgi:hypothetical protein
MKKLLPFLAIFLVVSLFFNPLLLRGKLPVPADSIAGLYHPFRDFFIQEFPQGYPFKNFLITDPMRQQFPWRELAVSAEKKLQLPLWNPYNGAGEPLLANIQSGALYPLNLIFFILPFALSWSVMIFLQPLLAGIFLYLYLANLRLSKAAATTGAIVFAFSGFSSAWLAWGTVMHTALWLPLVLMSIDKIIHRIKNYELIIKDKNIFVWSLIFIFSLSSAFFAGHLQTFFYLFIFSTVYTFARWIQFGKQKNIILLFAFCFLLFSIITIVQWLPTLQLISYSARDIDQIWQKEGWFIPWEHLVQFVAPDFFGNPSTLNYWGAWNYGEFVGYVGIFPLILALFAMFYRHDKKTFFFGAIFFLSLIFALPTFFAKIPYVLQIPLISTAQPTRLLFLTDFSLAVLASLGLDKMIKKYKSKELIFPMLFISFILLALWAFVLTGGRNLSEVSPNDLLVSKRNLLLPTILFIFSAVLISIWHFFSRSKAAGAILIVIILVVVSLDLLRFSSKFNTFSEARLLFPETKTTKFLSEVSAEYPWRFLAIDYVDDQKRIFAPNLSAHYGLYTLDTYNPLLLRRYQEFAAVSEWGFVDVPEFSFNRAIILNNFDSHLVDFLGVKYIIAINDTQSEKLKFIMREGESRIYENTKAYDRAFMVYDLVILPDKKEIARAMYEGEVDLKRTAIIEESVPIALSDRAVESSVRIERYEDNLVEISVSTEEEGFLVLTDTFYPTWKVKIDGKDSKIYRTDYSFRGVFVPAGEHVVIFENSLL